MYTLILVFHGIVAVCIIAVVLLQQGKGADVGSSFGGGSSQTIFGAPGTGNALSHLTALLVALFFLSSFGLAIYAGREFESGIQVEVPPSLQPAEEEFPGAGEALLPEEDPAGFEEDFPTPFTE